MFWVIVGVDIYSACGNEDEWGIDVDWKLNVAVFVSINLEFCFFFVIIKGFIVFFFFVLNFLFNYLINLAQPLHSGQHFGLSQLHRTDTCDAWFVDLIKNSLIIDLTFNIG